MTVRIILNQCSIKGVSMTFLFCSKDLNTLNFLLTTRTEKDCKMSFLDAIVFRENGKFVTNVYRKEIFTGVYTNFFNFIPLDYKFDLIYTLLHCCFCLVSDMSEFHFEIEKLKEIL